jgi:hypothetical protein
MQKDTHDFHTRGSLSSVYASGVEISHPDMTGVTKKARIIIRQ